MFIKKSILILIGSLFIAYAMAQEKNESAVSMNKIKLSFMLNEKGQPLYAVSYNEKPVIKPSQMGSFLPNHQGQALLLQRKMILIPALN